MKNWPIWKDFLDNPLIDGGLRKKGIFKTSKDKSILISYVTIVKNNPKTIERTIKSVQNQSYKNVEHIILDGASTDNTLDIIKKYSDVIDYFASKPDEGLYDGLNKVIELCRGDFILVLNSDDWLPEDSAKFISENYDNSFPILYCGSANVWNDKEIVSKWHPKEVTKNSYFKAPFINHNAIYASKKTYELSGPYDNSYSIAADTKWILKCYDSNIKFYYINEYFVNFSLGGESSDVCWHREECKRIMKEKYKFLKGDELENLSRIYYTSKKAFAYELHPFDHSFELLKIKNKYKNNKDFIEALDVENTINDLQIRYSK